MVTSQLSLPLARTSRSLLDEIRSCGDRAVVYDHTGALTREFFRPGRDRLLSPGDAQSERWSPWAEGLEPERYDRIAWALCEGSGGAWPLGTAAVLGDLLRCFEVRTSNRALAQVATSMSIDDLRETLDAYDAVAHLCETAPSDAALVFLSVASHLAAWRMLDEVPLDEAFSIRRFVCGEDQASDAWLFVSGAASDLAVAKPLLSLWAWIAGRAVADLEATRNRGMRVWRVFDDLLSLRGVPFAGVTCADERGGGR